MKYNLTILLLVLSISSFSQNCKLSTENQRYWDKAAVFVGEATSERDYQLAINEFDKILKTDKTCPDVYYNLGVLHSKLILKNGMNEVDKAKQNFDQYLILVPADRSLIKSEYSKIEARIEKYQNDRKRVLLEPFVGNWRHDVTSEGKIIGSSTITITFNENSLEIYYCNDKGCNVNLENNILSFARLGYYYEKNYGHNWDYDDRFGKYDTTEYIWNYQISIINRDTLLVRGYFSQERYYYNERLVHEESVNTVVSNTYSRVY